MLLSKSSDQQLVKIFGFLLVFVLLCFSIANNSFKDGNFTCNKYILNTYLYIVLTFNIIILLTLGLEYGNFSYQMSLLGLLGLFLVSIGCIFLMHSISPEKVLLKHFVWLAFVLIIGFIFYPLYIISDKGVVISAMFTTLSLTIFLSLIAYIKPEWISLSLGPILFIGLVSIIILELTMLFLFRNRLNEKRWIFRGISYFVIFLFMGYILYDTKRLQINAKECVKADYIKESLKLFLDIFNIFVRLVGLNRR